MSELVNCPEIVGDRRCYAVAEVVARFILESTEGPIEHINTNCFDGHRLSMPVEHLERAKYV